MSACVNKFVFLLYSTLVTSCIIGPFQCCHLLYLTIFLMYTIHNLPNYCADTSKERECSVLSGCKDIEIRKLILFTSGIGLTVK